MAVVSVWEKFGGRSGEHNRLWQRTYARAFGVETDDVRVGAIAVRTAAGLPQVGNYYTNGVASTDPRYEFDQGSFCSSVKASEDSDGAGVQWTVTCDYTPYDATQFDSDPTNWGLKVTHSAQKFEKVVWFDEAGNPIVNSAKDPFGDPITIDDSRSIVTVERNELVSAFDLTLAEQYRDKVNNAAWNGWAAKVVKCAGITTSAPQLDSNGHAWYYAVTYVFEVNRDTWVKQILDCGFNYLDGSSPAKAVPVMRSGQPASDPVPLDGSGHVLATTGTPVTLAFDVYPAVDFGVFNIDLSQRLGA